MSTIVFSNNANTTLQSGINNTATSLTVALGTGAEFPSPGAGQYFVLTLNDVASGLVYEVMHCTSRTGDTLTVVRGQESTSAVAWLAGDYVRSGPTAGQMSAMVQSDSAVLTNTPTAPTASIGDDSNTIATTAFVSNSLTGIVAMLPVAAGNVPPLWLIADGSLVSRTTYAELWAFANASGNITASDGAWSAATTPGSFSPGNGSTTFRLPDLRGLFIRGLDDGAGIDSGRTIGSHQADGFQDHEHSTNTGGTGNVIAGSGTPAIFPGANNTGTASTGRHGTETRPVNAALLTCIHV